MKISKKILIFSTGCGYCHKSTCNSIKNILEDIDVTFEEVEFYDLFGSLKLPFGSKKYSVPQLYNTYIQQKGNTGLIWIISIFFFLVILKIRTKGLNNRIDILLRKTKPDMIISVIPIVNKILCKRITLYSENFRLHTIVVDFKQPIYNIWIQSKKQVIYGWNKRLLNQARQFGLSSENIIDITGQLITPKLKKKNLRAPKEDLFIIYMVWGGNGSKRILTYAQQLEKTDSKIEINYIVGNNDDLYDSLSKILLKDNSTIFKFISDINEIYSRANLIIGKPGPNVISESIFTNVPLLLEFNRHTLFHERYNAKWAKINGVALLFNNCSDLKTKLNKLAFEPTYYEQLRSNTFKFSNSSAEIFKKSVLTSLYINSK